MQHYSTSARALTVLLATTCAFLAHAQTFKELVANTVIPLINSFIGLVVILATLAFIIGIIRFLAGAGDDKSIAAGKALMLWGTIAMFVAFSVWGIVTLIRDTFFTGAL